MSIFWNGSAINSLMWNGIQTTGVYNGNIVWGNNSQQAKTLTLYHSEGGTLTADTLTGYPGDSVNLTTAYNTYWRFSGYQWTGDGTLANNTYTFGSEDASICACYKVNAFTATGGFEKGSDASVVGTTGQNSMSIGLKYGILNSTTGNVPASWYSTSNRWNPSNASAYSLTANAKAQCKLKDSKYGSYGPGYTTGYFCFRINSTNSDGQSFTHHSTTENTYNYSKTIIKTNQGTFGISGYLIAKGGYYTFTHYQYPSTAWYIATGTNGSWTATGYAP